ncbi:hypothetical protein OMO38_08935 [Chryseobacterium sp. 09-1422]|uniref:Uncharacterized protein n=1 Tax=Chryseobacterium kimseyorum TaxID=2984028 RepID=A0ABT3HXX2_9FLAO|nr:hypothetical protein [Chryseobacterium kimseyorum]MCW3168652.1 hypothetical protein [Chryseobacterium kimseyorum]
MKKNIKNSINHIFGFALLLLFGTMELSAQRRNLEMAAGAGNPTDNGPVTVPTGTLSSRVITLQENTDNAVAGTAFAAYTPGLTATISLRNQYANIGTGSTTYPPMLFGGSMLGNESTPVGAAIFPTMNQIFSAPVNTNYTNTSTATSGTGIEVSANKALNITIYPYPLYDNSLSFSGRHYMGDITIAFNRPVNNPIVHFVDLGAFRTTTYRSSFSTEYDFDLAGSTPSTGITMSKRSGTNYFSVTSNQINHSNIIDPNAGTNGSVQFTGNNITVIKLKIHLRGSSDPGGSNTGSNSYKIWYNNASPGGRFYFGETVHIGVSLSEIKPSGTIYRDNDGSTTIDGGGTGGGTWNTANTLYVNAISTTGNVLATAAVDASGIFTFDPGGNLIAGNVVKFQLSKNQGIVGQPAPAKELPPGWTTVGESTVGGTSDSTPDGEFTVTLGSADISNDSTYRFGIVATAICNAGTTQVPLNGSTLSN